MIAYILSYWNYLDKSSGLDVYDDSRVIFDTQHGINEGCTSCSFELKYNEPGSLEFTLLNKHPLAIAYSNNLYVYETTIALYMTYLNDSGEVLDEWYPFVGRVTTISRDMYGNISVTCEGAMAYLNNTMLHYYDYKYDRFNDFIQEGITNYNNFRLAFTEPQYNRNWRHIEFDYGTPGSSNSFTFTKEYDKENKNVSYMKVLDGIKEHILDAYGGILHFIYYPNYDADDYMIKFGYYGDITTGFDYNTRFDDMPTGNCVISIQYGRNIPCFGIEDNIINISEESIKTGLWNALLPISSDGFLLNGEGIDIGSQDLVSVRSQITSYGGIFDTIIKPVEFSINAKKEDGSWETYTLFNKARQYISRFADRDYFSMKNYSIEGIEPCLVFPEVNKIIKPLYPVILKKDYDNELVDYPCISIRHNCFDAQSSQYTIGPIILQNIINENISTWK